MRLKTTIFRATLVAVALATLLTGCSSAASQSVSSQPSQSQTESAASSQAEEPVEIPVDFDEWQKVNKDVYAWINVPGTNIDYPVLQSDENTDSDYYLEYCIDHTYGRPGCIYSEREYNTKTFEDFVTILYGHDMWTDDTYFHQLHLLEDKSFFDEHRQILIYTPDKALTYTIFGVLNYDDRHLMMSNYGFTMPSDKEKFLNEIYDTRDMSAILDQNMKERVLEEDSRILILSTCNQIAANQRFLVFAVLD